MVLTPRFPHFLHGGDYNPDQWLDREDILEKDAEAMEKAHVNAVSLGIFAWDALEPEEGVYDFAWLDRVMDRLWRRGIHVILATPSGARPAWMAEKYPEVLRVNSEFRRNHFGGRHNHCPSSPVYREKVRGIDTALARRYASHPAVILWHISNEFSGDCYCPLCQERFRDWLREKYGTLDELNRAWFTGFWSMRYTAWSQIEPPSPMGQMSNLSLLLDWRRFSTWQCRDFISMEKEAVHACNPELPCTANLMEAFWDYDYFSLAEVLDVVSWDNYPAWRGGDDERVACGAALNHDMMYALKKQPFLMMESTPSNVNWHSVNKLKKPGMHLLSSMQAVAHGSQSVLYFQWRKGRGNAEMFHGAVLSHDGRSDTRVFRDVTEVGEILEKLDGKLYAADVPAARVCILYDWNCRWAVENAQTGLAHGMAYHETVLNHYHAFWRAGIPVTFCDMREETDLSGFSLVICPQLYMFMNGIEEKLRAFTEAGGTLVMTYFSGIADSTNLTFLGDAPHSLTDVFGVRETEMDALYPDEENTVVMDNGRTYRATGICSLLAEEGCEVAGTYGKDFYAGGAAITRNAYGKGTAWYIGARLDPDCLDDFYTSLASSLHLEPALDVSLPRGVIAHRRGDMVFLQNYSGKPAFFSLPGSWQDACTDEKVPDTVELPAWSVRMICKESLSGTGE